MSDEKICPPDASPFRMPWKAMTKRYRSNWLLWKKLGERLAEERRSGDAQLSPEKVAEIERDLVDLENLDTYRRLNQIQGEALMHIASVLPEPHIATGDPRDLAKDVERQFGSRSEAAQPDLSASLRIAYADNDRLEKQLDEEAAENAKLRDQLAAFDAVHIDNEPRTAEAIPMLVPIDDVDRAAAVELIDRCRYMPDSMAQKAAVAHALATARRRERQRLKRAAAKQEGNAALETGECTQCGKPLKTHSVEQYADCDDVLEAKLRKALR